MNGDVTSPNLANTIQLLQEVRAGNKQALSDLYARYGDRLLAVVRLRLGWRLRSKLESCDIVQDALLASLRGVENTEFSSNGAFFHWLTKIVERRICDKADYYAAQRRDVTREKPLAAACPTTGSVFGPIAQLATFGTPSQNVARKEDLERLERAIDQLPDEQKEALLLVRYEGMTLAEAGDTLDRSPDAVRMLVARALVSLGKNLRKDTS